MLQGPIDVRLLFLVTLYIGTCILLIHSVHSTIYAQRYATINGCTNYILGLGDN